ncbi:alginate lyase family protein (plasmid) [Pedobacter sp. BS3]|uniref:alginate lyase family protein n=1 Tax=Pedobacter sp. BS3 TaxID=2567937 RepID=UPI0011EF54DB|nr:alginate lyase family protein [Pedobacter sp. BS3]TZF86057.1 alginate lyase family protein [Pedobacter sp. BS3]
MTTRILLLLTILLLAFTTKAQYVSLNPQELQQLKSLIKTDVQVKKLYASIQHTAEQALFETPNPIDTIRTEGLLKGHPKKTATAAALKDMPKMYALALTYRVSNDNRYLEKAIDYLKAWAAHNTPNGDPIDDTNLDDAIEAYDLIKEKLNADDITLISGWLKKTAETEITSKYNSPKRSTSYNNWHSHRLKIIGEIAYAINNEQLQQYTINELKTQLERNLNPDGSSIDFKLRDALHYHVYDLEPLLELAIVLKRATGVNYYTWQSPTGSSIEKSVNWLLPYLNGQKTHQEYVNTTVKFDIARAKNNEAGHEIGALFEPRKGTTVLLLASYFNDHLQQVANNLLQTTAHYPKWQTVLNEIMNR